MSDDAPHPRPDFYDSASRSFAKLTHFLDNNIRVMQYGVYCVGAAGLVLVLHSIRAVEHTPVIPLLRWKSDQPLPLQLVDIEVTEDGFEAARGSLTGQRVWFTLISHDPDEDVLKAYVRPAKLLQRKSINEELVRDGLALAVPMDLALHADTFYSSRYARIHHAQDQAEKRQVGMWKSPVEMRRGVLARLWGKVYEMMSRSK